MRDHLLQHLLRYSAEQHPEKIALVFKERSVTYSDLDRQSNGLALKLSAGGNWKR